MAKTDYKSVDDYIAAQPQAVRAVLECVRSAIRKAVPGAQEVISYQIPAYKLHGVPVLYFAGWKEHYSLYPVSEGLVAELEGQRATYSFSKGTMRLPLGEPVPTRLIARIAKSRAREVTEKHNAKAGAKTQR